MTSPKMPRANFCQRGALTIGSKNAGRAISGLEPARDLEGHEARCLGDLLACHDDVHFLEPSGCPEVLHEVRHRGRGERRAPEEEDSAFFLDARDPEVLRNDVGEGVQEPQRPALGLRQLGDDLHALSKFGCLGLRRRALTGHDGQRGQLAVHAVDLAGEPALVALQLPPVRGDPAQRGEIHDEEEEADIEARQLELKGWPRSSRRRQVDPDHSFLSPGWRRARPTATASDGPAAPTTSEWPPPTSIRANGWASSTGMPHVEERDRKSTRLNSSHGYISYAVFCLKKK